MNRSLLIIYFFTGICYLGHSQENRNLPDSVIIVNDSVDYSFMEDPEKATQDSLKYKELEKLSKKSRMTEALYRLFFKTFDNKPKYAYREFRDQEAGFHRRAQGRTIRNINITTLDPFGYNLEDSTVTPGKFILKTGNLIHVKTNTSVIKNLLLFHTYDVYDSLLVKESERLIRSQTFVRDVFLRNERVGRDSVDVMIRVQDVWSTLPSLRISGHNPGFGLTDLNFAGTGTAFRATTYWNKGSGNVTHLSYLMPNIRSSYASLNLQYLFSPGNELSGVVDFDNYYYSPVSYNPKYMFSDNRNIIRSIEVNRPFYSPYAKAAGGLFLGQAMTTQNYIDDYDTLRFVSEKTNITDLWAGRSWRLNRFRTSGEGFTSLILSGRFVRTLTPGRTQMQIDRNIFGTHNYFFGGISLSSRKYYRDRYIFNYGKTEDVPAGMIAGITVGKEYQQRSRFYLGLNGGWGKYYSFGYLSSHLSYGTFKGSGGFQQGIFSGRITYFTRLLNAGTWRLRQFITTSFVFGLNRFPADNQPLKVGIKGFESIESLATNIGVISLQTQSYAPGSIAGFHFGPYFFSQFGILGEDPLVSSDNRYYSLMGLGLLIKNDYLMFNTFQVSISFYPFIPDRGYNIFRANAYKTTDFGFRDFQVSKPGIIE